MVCPLGKICFEITHCFKNKYTKYSKFAIVENIIAEFKNITDPKFFFKNFISNSSVGSDMIKVNNNRFVLQMRKFRLRISY